jgi:choline dehydrogenase
VGHDVIVVGAGAAGCVVAARLAENNSRSVLLIEAGPDMRSAPPPDLHDAWSFPRDFEWGFHSEPHAGGEVLNLRRGKLVGGTGWVTRFGVRGSPRDYDGWAAIGNEGWSFEEVLPYLNKIEADADFGQEPWHGDGGPIPVDRYLQHEPMDVAAAASEAALAGGFPAVEDHNRPGAVGVGRMPMTSRSGRRVTTADAYLPEGASNLSIRPGCQVDEILFDGTRARGVRLVGGAEIEAGHVVMCAGVYGDPAILMRSGIGPGDHLRSLGIAVRVDLVGVGSNLADHPQVEIEMAYRGTPRAEPSLHSIATFQSDASLSEEAPDLMLWFGDPIAEPTVFTLEVVLLKPQCRGTVRLRSPGPVDSPCITLPRVDDSDVRKLATGYARAADLAMHPSVQRFCDAPGIHVGRALEDFVRSTSYSIPHVVGTCAMGPSPDDGAVVDTDGHVHGTEGLSIIDASMIPEPPSGFPHLPTIMIAERLSERLAQDL